ncbi:MAG: aminotransferase class I/II-fold pyridoxal phosphate-dependent enzyme [Methanobacteriota archaeon]|nr:MAG: aminotransferase class I/II-fold pyridoxal phosphate-dependent enzyme [Euryarchaeota archaeon]
MKAKQGLSTKCVHAGKIECGRVAPVASPIFQTSSYYYPTEEGEGYIYTRHGNPTQEIAEDRIAALEGAQAGLVFSSGMAAITTTVLSTVGEGGHLIAFEDLYGNTYTFFRSELKRFGIDVTFIKTKDASRIGRFFRSNTKAVFFESPTNPLMRVLDISRVSQAAHKWSAKAIIDNTFATPINQRPLELGVDIVVHSGSKYLNGHSDVISGLVAGSKKDLHEIEELRTTMGGCLDPNAAYLLQRGMMTLCVRMAKHNENGLKVAEFLENHKKVNKVHYPGLPSHPDHELAKSMMHGFGGMLSFEIKGRRREANRFLNELKLLLAATSLGGAETLISVPAETSHSYLSRRERLGLGIKDNLVRMSVGIEDFEDIKKDLNQALSKI